MARLSALQLCSTPKVEGNLKTIRQLLIALTKQYSETEHLVVLPECCLFFGGEEAEQLSLAQQNQGSYALQNSLAELAIEFRVYLVAGTIPIIDKKAQKFTNSCCIFSPEGKVLAQYDKIHLFDVCVADKSKNYQESKFTKPGDSVTTSALPFATVGLAICYDLRFSALFTTLRQQGAEIITVPSAFTRVTGEAHWQALLQARAIENQVYIIAAGQEGVHENGRETWGHSMIISPWGEILAVQNTGEGYVSAEFSSSMLSKVRTSMPVFEHNKFKVELTPYE